MSARISFPNIPKGLFQAMMNAEDYVNRCGFDPKLLELLRLRVAEINGCAYCVDMHFKEGLHHNEKIERLYAVSVWREAPFYSPMERAVLGWTETVTLPHQPHDLDAQFKTLREYFTEEQVANLTMAVVQINSWTRLAKSFGFEAGHYKAGAHS